MSKLCPSIAHGAQVQYNTESQPLLTVEHLNPSQRSNTRDKSNIYSPLYLIQQTYNIYKRKNPHSCKRSCHKGQTGSIYSESNKALISKWVCQLPLEYEQGCCKVRWTKVPALKECATGQAGKFTFRNVLAYPKFIRGLMKREVLLLLLFF